MSNRPPSPVSLGSWEALAPGYYLLRLHRRGWQVPCRITLAHDIYECMIDGVLVWGGTATDLDALRSVWPEPQVVVLMAWGEQSTEAAYNHRNATREHYREYDPNHPAMNPTRPIETRLLKPEDF